MSASCANPEGVITRRWLRSAGRAGRVELWLFLVQLCLLPLQSQGQQRQLPKLDTPIERQLAGGEVHRYRVQLSQGEVLWLEAAQDGIDVTVAIVGLSGETVLAVDNPSDLWGEEWLLFRATEAAKYVVEVRSLTSGAAPGRYRLKAETFLPLGLADRQRFAAESAVTKAGRLYYEGTREARRRALEDYREAFTEWQALGRDAEAAHTLFLVAIVHRKLDEPREALLLLRQVLAHWRRLGRRRGQAQTLKEIATTSQMLGEAEGVEETYRQALDLWRELGDLHGQARTLNYLGLVQARRTPRSALEYYEEALRLFRQLGDTLQEGVVLNNVGGIHDLLGEPHPALEHFNQALDIYHRLGDRWQEAGVWNNIASVYRRTGKLQEALDGYGRSLDFRRELGDRRGEGRVLNNLGLTWLLLGDAVRARDVLRESLVLRRRTEDRRGEAITLRNLGLAHADLEQWDEALELWARALVLRRALGDRSGEAATLVSMGRAEGYRGRLVEARRHLEDALDILEEIANPWRQAQALWRLGQILTIAGEPEEATVALDRSLKLYRTTGDEVRTGDALLALARAEQASAKRQDDGRLMIAYARATDALDLLEAVRADVDSLGLRASFLSQHRDAFELTIDLAMELDRRQPSAGWAAKALEISERARARSLLDLLEESGAGLRRGVDAALFERQRALLERLNAKADRRRRHLKREGPSATSVRLAAEMSEVRAELEEVENEIRRQSPAWGSLSNPRLLEGNAIQAMLDAETTLLEYSLGEERSFLWAVTRDRIDSFELPGRQAIEAAAREVYEGFRIHDPRARRADAEAAARLSGILLGPVADRLSGTPDPGATPARRLAVVADGALHYLPFAALPHPVSDEPLLVRYEVVSLPSASALAVQRQTLAGRPPARESLAVFADPVFATTDPRLAGAGPTDLGAAALTLASADPAYRDARSGDLRLDRLAWSRWEAEAIAERAGEGKALVALGFDADLAAVRSGQLQGHRIVHFATHGIVESEHPELSALVLSLYDAEGRSREGFLRLPEIYNLELDAELVVLSGCRTALGREIRGEGLVGLTRGFFAAGARHLVASLWRVQDRSTAELMDRFYRRLLQGSGGRLRPAAALRQAQGELINEPEFRDPYHWAAFAVYGDWR